MTDEERWFRRFKRVCASKPKGIEVMLHNGGYFTLVEDGSIKEAFDRDGHVDMVEYIDAFTAEGFHPCSESI